MIIDKDHFLFHIRGMGVTLDGQPIKHVSLVELTESGGKAWRYKTYLDDGKEKYELRQDEGGWEPAVELLTGNVRLTLNAILVPADFPAYLRRAFPNVMPYLDVLNA